MDRVLLGRRALVGGASQGIGKACAVELAKLGAGVTLVARTESVLQEILPLLDSSVGQKHHYLCLDYGLPEEVRKAVAQHVRITGPIHILVNNTGGPTSGPLLDAAPEDFLTTFNQHVICNQLLVQVLVPGMKEAGYGRIINITSVAVKEPIVGLGLSNTVRAGVVSWAKTLSRELGPYGITINNVLPGYTDTERLREVIGARARQSNVTPQQMAEQFRSTIPLGRFARPEEIAAGVAFLASPAAAYITGINLPIDGGRLQSL